MDRGGLCYCRWCHSWAGDPEFVHGCASHEEQADKQHLSRACALVPASRFLSCLCSCPDFLHWWTMMQSLRKINPFYHSCFGPWFYHSNSNPNKVMLVRLSGCSFWHTWRHSLTAGSLILWRLLQYFCPPFFPQWLLYSKITYQVVTEDNLIYRI